MHYADVELSRELYKLSGWESDHWYKIDEDGSVEVSDHKSYLKWIEEYPAYDLGYLLRKLPEWIELEMI